MYGIVGNHGFLSSKNELILPVNTSFIKSKEQTLKIKELIEKLGVVVSFSLDIDEDDHSININESAVFHHSFESFPLIMNIDNESIVDDLEIIEQYNNQDINDASDFTRLLSLVRKEKEIYYVDPSVYGIMDNFRLFPNSQHELVLPLNTSYIKSDQTHRKIKKMIEQMKVIVGFSIIHNEDERLIILQDDNCFGDLAYRGLKWDFRTESFVIGNEYFNENIIEPEKKIKSIEENYTKRDVMVFLSYATKDSNKFKISTIARELTKHTGIKEVLFWEEDMDDDIIDYMNKNIGKCDIFILFCSKNALQSDPVRLEWQAALKIKKKIIPVFIDEKDIPPLLSSKLGVNFIKNDIGETISNLYYLILKKVKKAQ